MISVSCLVISRTPALLNQCLVGLKHSRAVWQENDEVLCSWNGKAEDLLAVSADLGPIAGNNTLFRIAELRPYHFAENMNILARHAKGDILVLINDDLILDTGSLDRAIEVLMESEQIGIVGGLLRGSNGQMSHAGLLFNQEYYAYNRFHPEDLGSHIRLDDPIVKKSVQIPALTGAFMVMEKADFLSVSGFNTEYRVCGEDIALCLSFWNELGKYPYYSASITGIHDERTTRGSTPDHDDLARLAIYARGIESLDHSLAIASHIRSQEENVWLWGLVQQQKSIAAEFRERVTAIEGSTSWRITRPLRWFAQRALNTSEPLSSKSRSDLHIVFDTTVLARGHRENVSRGGIYRYAYELAKELANRRSREGESICVSPFCLDPVLSLSAAEQWKKLEGKIVDHSESIDLISRRWLSWKTPSVVRGVIKRFYNRLIRSSLIRKYTENQLKAGLTRSRAEVTIFHTPFQSVPDVVRQCGITHVAVTIHDMLPLKHPEFFTSETIRNFKETLDKLKSSDHIICVSQSTRRDFLHYRKDIPPEQVHVTPLASSADLRPVTDTRPLNEMRHQLGLGARDQVILSLCTLEPRKNLITLIDAFESLDPKINEYPLKLVLAGAMGWKTTSLTERIQSSPRADFIAVTGYIPDGKLATLYSLADVFVYPSLYEGFGLPPLEAMQCGTPTIVGNTSSLPEVVGDAAYLIDPSSTEDLCTALLNVLGSTALRERMRQKGLKQASLFSWEATTTATLEVYRKMLHRG